MQLNFFLEVVEQMNCQGNLYKRKTSKKLVEKLKNLKGINDLHDNAPLGSHYRMKHVLRASAHKLKANAWVQRTYLKIAFAVKTKFYEHKAGDKHFEFRQIVP